MFFGKEVEIYSPSYTVHPTLFPRPKSQAGTLTTIGRQHSGLLLLKGLAWELNHQCIILFLWEKCFKVYL